MRTVIGIEIGMENIVTAVYSHNTREMTVHTDNIRRAEYPATVSWAAGTAPRSVPAFEMTRRGGAVFRDYLPRVGDPVPLVADDGTSRTGEALLAAQIAIIVGSAASSAKSSGNLVAAVTYPSSWHSYQVTALRAELRNHGIGSDRFAGILIAGGTAALAWMRHTGRDTRTPFLLCDGGTGSIDAALIRDGDRWEPARRFEEFSLESGIHALSEHVSAQLDESIPGQDIAAALSLQRSCKAAVHELSRNTSTTISVGAGAAARTIRVVRSEFEELIADRVEHVAGIIADLYFDPNSPGTQPHSIVVCGDAAAVPLLVERLSARSEVPVRILPEPALVTLRGAVLLGVTANTGRVPSAPSPADGSTAPQVTRRAHQPNILDKPDPPRTPPEQVPVQSLPTRAIRPQPASDETPGRRFWTRGRKFLAAAAATVVLLIGGAFTVFATDIENSPAHVTPTSVTNGTHSDGTGGNQGGGPRR